MSVDALLRGRPAPPTSKLVGGRVSKVEADGDVYVTPEGGDERHPLGPCRGAKDRSSGVPVPLPKGTQVLLAITTTGPWVVSWEETS